MSSSFPSQWPAPRPAVHRGKFVVLTPTDLDGDMEELFAAGHGTEKDRALWEFLPIGPFADVNEMRVFFAKWQALEDVVAFTVSCGESSRKIGMISLLRVNSAHGVAELGMIWYAPSAQRTKSNTEAVYLLLSHLFDELHYRRAEWKCDNANERSKAAALRLGFQYEGLFRQHMVRKGHNRDTAWFSILDGEWPLKKSNLERWLYGSEKVSLSQLNNTVAA